ncbi:hypothetical protein ES708_18681 [subsurface metagenome]
MREVIIKQKDFVTHTIFMYGGRGKVFPGDNYQIAKEWLEEGKLCESSKMEMEAIEKAREKEKEEESRAR